MPTPPPSTDRVTLAKITADDLDDLVMLDSDPLVMRHLTGGVPTPRKAYIGENGILSRMIAYPNRAMGYFSARHHGGFIGWFHLRPSVFDPTVPEVGFRLMRKAWGKGLATETSRALCSWAFQDLGATHVDACALKENVASINVIRKCEMTWVSTASHPRAPELLVERYMVSRDVWANRTK
ncbi:MAG: RimJ/RimL family protein N-acetyltransferase [Kiritimatiellia bacterium]|jgi:RimJ/RimL family protein N-acetyltransferase